MSGIGFWELIILFLIGLIVLGPERLPRVANQLGSWLGQARRMTRVMKRQLEEELDLNKALDINPPRTNKPKNDEDDAYSPAHDADAVGTGFDDDSQDDEDESKPELPKTGDAPEDESAKESA